METPASIREQWLQARARLVAKGFLREPNASLSLRCPAGGMWYGAAADPEPVQVTGATEQAGSAAQLHARVYAARPDVGAVAWGGGPFGACLGDFGGRLPQVFDEQARHIGPMAPPPGDDARLDAALRGRGNALLWRHAPLCFGTTGKRLALNVELFEKCAKAYVLAAAAGGRVAALPWLVRHVANSRLARDQRRAAAAFARGELPAESSAY